MGAGVEQRAWTPTVRNAPIAAEHMSPGPACVQLPALVGSKVQDSKKHGAPAFSIGHKYRSRYETIGPGPAQYNVSGLGMKGRDSPPAATLQSRPKERSQFSTPAPGEYNVERSTKAVIGATPKYTFGRRPAPPKPSITPGPNVYKIPTILGSSKEGPIKSAPAFSLTGREKPRCIPSLVIPGPGAYDGEYTLTKRKPPVYTMRGKYKMPSDEHMKPGPGSHCPEKYIWHKSVPAPSFSILHTPYLGQRKFYLVPPNYSKQQRCL